jgi:hypothetical protein
VSGAPIKPPRNFYWTERGFAGLGKPVAIPAAQVGDVAIVYNRNFPKTNDTTYVGPGDTTPGGTTNASPEFRTLWWDKTQGYLSAYNVEGRLMLELLGNFTDTEHVLREPLGIEIVDVIKSPNPVDATIELGERITPPIPDPDQTLTPEPVLDTSGRTFAYNQQPGNNGGQSGSALVLYATHETANLNDYQVHWMETSIAGLKWPKVLGRHQI